ncbi:MAG: hypothetical protein JO112_14895 [Planctomycetes bacterium]|nr:hypothetical protein [Planctomycetota bacterium]
MYWLSWLLAAFLGLLGLWHLLLAYRILGKPPGQDPNYDAYMKTRSRRFKVLGLGWFLLCLLQVLFILKVL